MHFYLPQRMVAITTYLQYKQKKTFINKLTKLSD